MDDWADGHGYGSGHRTPEEIPKEGEATEEALHAMEMAGVNAKDKHITIDKDSEAAVAGILDKATREPHGQLGENPDGTQITSESHRTTPGFPVGVAAVLQAISPMGVCDPSRQAQRDRAKELVDELYERVPWEDFIAELSSRGTVLVKAKDLQAKDEIRQVYYTGHMNADAIAEEAGRKIRSFLGAAKLLVDCLYVEEGEPETIKTLISSAISEVNRAGGELVAVRKRMHEARQL